MSKFWQDCAVAMVVRFRHQPFASDPLSWPASSATYSDHVPLACVPRRAASLVAGVVAGAGAGRRSAPSKLAGTTAVENMGTALSPWFVPASSSKVSCRFAIGLAPPESDITITGAGAAGPTSRTSRSSAKLWLNPFNVTVALATEGSRPDTVMVEG